MASIDVLTTKSGKLKLSATKYSLLKNNGSLIELDLTKATTRELEILELGTLIGETAEKFASGKFVQTNEQNQPNQIQQPNDFSAELSPNDLYNFGAPTGNSSMNSSRQSSNNKVLSKTTPYFKSSPALPDDRFNFPYQGTPNGFISKILITLLAGFGIGAITTAVYIFINLGKVTINLP